MILEFSSLLCKRRTYIIPLKAVIAFFVSKGDILERK